jgi:putative ABC transport system ATP-binding protein
MERSLFRFVWTHSKPQQLYLFLLVLASVPFNYLLLDVPKNIVNEAIGQVEPPHPLTFYGVQYLPDVGQLPLLVMLCVLFLALVVGDNAIKYHLGVCTVRAGERLLRRMRYELYSRVLRFPLPHFRRAGQGEVVAMITGQAQQVGDFAGAAYVEPVSLCRQLLVNAGFIVVQDPLLGLAAIMFYPLQMWLIPMLQRRIAALAKERQRRLRKLSEHIGESMLGIQEMRAHGAAPLELSRFTDRQGEIYAIRVKIQNLKNAQKFLNNFLDKLAPFFFYLIGGWLLIEGRIFIGGYEIGGGGMTIGGLMAVIAAHKDMGGPWKDLLTWYQNANMCSEIYEDMIDQFDPPGLMRQEPETTADPQPVGGALTLSNVGYVEDDGATRLASTSLEIAIDRHTAVIGPEGGGKQELMLLLARFFVPSSGHITVGGADLAQIPASALGRRFAYVGANAYLQAGSMRDAMLYALKQRPRRPKPTASGDRRHGFDLAEARRAGNSTLDYHGMDWVDWAAAGAANEAELTERMLQALSVADLADDIYQMGLRGLIDPDKRPEVAENIVHARRALADRLQAPEFKELVEPFDRARYNTNATVAENLLFGTAVGEGFAADDLAGSPYVVALLRSVGLYDDFVVMGQSVAQTMVELFADLPPGHEFFQQFSFIESDDLPVFQAVLTRAERGGIGRLAPADTIRLLALPFKLIASRHRLDLIDAPMQQRLLEARQAFAAGLPLEMQGAVEFFDRERYNRAASVQDNILFGKIAYGQPAGPQRIAELIGRTLEDLGMRGSVIEAGLDFEVGVGGSRLSPAQRQKVALARALLRQSDLLLVNEATASLDHATEERVLTQALAARAGQGVVWALTRAELAAHFDEVIEVEHGHALKKKHSAGRKSEAAE